MSRKISVFTLIVLTLALILIPSVHAEYPIDDLVVVQDLPENMVAGSTYVMVILFDNIAKESVTFYVNITVTGDPSIGQLGEILVNWVKLNGEVLPCVETGAGIFSTPAGGELEAMSRNRLDINVSTVPNLMPGAYTFEIDLMGEEMEPKPGPKQVIGRPNAEPKADAGPNQKAWVGGTVYFDGSKSEDTDGIIESYEWDFGDGATDSGVAVEHEYSELGQYTVTLTVRDDRWSYDSDTCKVKVSEPKPFSDKFAERVKGNKTGHVVDAMEEANTTVTLDTTDNVTVTVLRYENNPHPEDPIPASALPTYVDVEVSDPDAVVWPIYVEMYYTDEEIGDLDENTFGIYYWKDDVWQRCSNTGVDTVLNIVWAYMTAEEASGSPILIAGMHAIPTPPVPPFLDNLTVTPTEIELGDNVTISLDIMNIDSQTYAIDIHIENVNDPPPTWPPMDVYLRIWVDLEDNESKTVSHNITMDAVGDFNVTVAGMTASFKVGTWPPEPPPKPAEFVVSDLSITPEEAELWEGIDDWTFKITANVMNIGEQEGTHTVDLKVDGLDIDWRTVKLGGGESTPIIFDVTRGVGSYTVEVDGLTGSFTVKAAPEPEFVVSDLVLTPSEIEPGGTVIVSAKIANVGEMVGSYTVELKVDGETVDTESVTLAGGAAQYISFTISSEEEGEHAVEVDGVSDSFTVKSVPPPKKFPWTSILIVVAIIAAIAYVIIWVKTDWIQQLLNRIR